MTDGALTMQEALREGRDALRGAGIQEAELDSWYLLEYVTGVDRARYFVNPARPLSQGEEERYRECISLRCGRIPLQHIIGEQQFMGLSFFVDRDVLIPRQDTEILVECALDLIKEGNVPLRQGELRLLDMCTGSGCILLSVLHYGPSSLKGVGADISAEALLVAKRNRDRLGLRADFVKSDMFGQIEGEFDMILSNPPYIPTGEIERLEDEVRLHDPRGALDGGEDGLDFYREISVQSAAHLSEGGVLAFEIGWNQAKQVEDIMRDAHFCHICVKKDLAGLDRVVYGVYSGNSLNAE